MHTSLVMTFSRMVLQEVIGRGHMYWRIVLLVMAMPHNVAIVAPLVHHAVNGFAMVVDVNKVWRPNKSMQATVDSRAGIYW